VIQIATGLYEGLLKF